MLQHNASTVSRVDPAPRLTSSPVPQPSLTPAKSHLHVSLWLLREAGALRSDELLLNEGVLASKCCWYPSDGSQAIPA